MSVVKRTPLAKDDLVDIWVYIAIENQSPDNVDRFMDKLEKEFFKLARNPMIGTDRSHRIPGLRGWPFGNYLILYKPLPHGVEIIRVISGRRDMEKQKFQ